MIEIAYQCYIQKILWVYNGLIPIRNHSWARQKGDDTTRSGVAGAMLSTVTSVRIIQYDHAHIIWLVVLQYDNNPN